MPREKRTLTIDPEVDDLLARVGNASDYVSRVVAIRWREWTAARATLVGAGWRPAEILAACDVLNGYWMIGDGRRPGFVAAELFDGQRLNNICEKWHVQPDQWTERVKTLAQRADIAHALCILVEEFWTGNEACEAAIRKDKAGEIIAAAQQSSGLSEEEANELAVSETRAHRQRVPPGRGPSGS